MVAALSQLHHSVEKIRDVAVTVCSQTEETEVTLQDSSVVLLLDIRQLNLHLLHPIIVCHQLLFFNETKRKKQTVRYYRKLTSMMVSCLGAKFFSTSSFSLLNIIGFKMACSF